MSENRFKVSKADPDGTTEPKETYRRVNLSTDIEVNIIEPCMSHFFFCEMLTTCDQNISRILSHFSCSVDFCHTGILLLFFTGLRRQFEKKMEKMKMEWTSHCFFSCWWCTRIRFPTNFLSCSAGEIRKQELQRGFGSRERGKSSIIWGILKLCWYCQLNLESFLV